MFIPHIIRAHRSGVQSGRDRSGKQRRARYAPLCATIRAAEAGSPFTDEQNRELALVMEEQRQASERLFGDIMDFSGGPVRGADRALSGIQWRR